MRAYRRHLSDKTGLIIRCRTTYKLPLYCSSSTALILTRRWPISKSGTQRTTAVQIPSPPVRDHVMIILKILLHTTWLGGSRRSQSTTIRRMLVARRSNDPAGRTRSTRRGMIHRRQMNGRIPTGAITAPLIISITGLMPPSPQTQI